MLRLPVTYSLDCVTPRYKHECKGKKPHCYVVRNRKKVALVWLDPVHIEKDYDLLDYEKDTVLLIVNQYKYELEEEYRRVANGW